MNPVVPEQFINLSVIKAENRTKGPEVGLVRCNPELVLVVLQVKLPIIGNNRTHWQTTAKGLDYRRARAHDWQMKH